MMDIEKKKNNSKDAETILAKVVFTDYVDKYCQGKKEFIQPTYFKDELKIEDPRSFEKKMIKDGYIKKDGGLAVTEKGYKLIEQYGDYLRFFYIATPYGNITDYQRWRNKKRSYQTSFEETVITMLSDKLKSFREQDDYKAVENIHFEIGRQYHSASYDAQAMYHYLNSLYFEVSGLQYYDRLVMFMLGKNTRKSLEAEYDGVYIDPHLVAAIQEIKDVYYEDMADAVYKKNPISINMCTLDKFKELAEDIIAGRYDMEKWRGYFFSAFNGLIRTAEKNTANSKRGVK